jgi:2,4-dienoyl-CoA reductase-like NADH-dependent reductase (Old Yellow Enzyme family)
MPSTHQGVQQRFRNEGKTVTDLFEPIEFSCGVEMPNRFMLAPLTNMQSHSDGTLSDEELHWLTMRALGGFGATMTCASHVQAVGQGFPGQLGNFGEQHVAGLARLATSISNAGSVAITQLHHAGNRSPRDLIGTQPICPSDDARNDARALTNDEVHGVVQDFVAAAERAQRAGFHGVELHGAHGYLLCQFLSAELNQRTDEYGGSLENRSRIIVEILEGIRAKCGQGLLVGIRLSPERFGMQIVEIRELAQQLMSSGLVDFIDMSLWDSFKEPVDPAYAGRTLIECFADLNRGGVRLGAAGNLYDGADMRRAIDLGLDFVLPGRAAVLHHDLPRRILDDPDFVATRPPVTSAYLRNEGLSDVFVGYMSGWAGFVVDPA